jgi:outer membrane protein
MPRLFFLFLLSAVLAAGTAAAQTADAAGRPLPARLTLENAIARASANSHRLAEMKARHGAARAVTDQSTAARMPTVDAQLGYQRTNHVDEFGFASATGFRILYPDVPDNYRSRLELQWPIYTGGRLQALERAAAAEADAVGQDLESARADLKLEVTRAYWALVTAREATRVLSEAVKRVDAQLSDVRSRFEAGFVPPNDVLTVQAQRARQQVQLLEAQNQAATAEADLARLIDAPADVRIELDAVLSEPPIVKGTSLATLVPEARTHRADRAALATRAGAADDRTSAARAGHLPSVAFVTGVDYARPNPKIFPREDAWKHAWDVGVNLTWSLWDSGRTRAEIAEASNLAMAARERLAEFDSVLTFEVRQRMLDLESARAAIAAAGEGVTSATEARRVVQERFEAGVATTTDLLDAQVALLQAELDRTRALANTRLAQARLERAVGR